MKYVVCYSGGHSSALAAIETVRRFGRENVILLNHNISGKVEHEEIKLFKSKVAEFLHLPITYANCDRYEQRTPLSLCREHGIIRFRGGHAICTYYLKTEPFHLWLAKNYPVQKNMLSEEIKIVYGFDKTEDHRIARRRQHLQFMGYESMYPLAEWPETIHAVEEVGIQRPSIYAECKHANCIGCLKAGKQHWYKVYCCHPAIFEEAKLTEERIGYSILRNCYLSDLEPEYARMKRIGVPPLETMEQKWFWHYARRRY